MMGMGIVDHDDADPVWRGLAEEYEGAASEIEPWRRLDSMRDRSDEFVAGGWYASVDRRTYLWELAYGAEAYVALLETMSAYRALADDVREELFERMRRRIAAKAGRFGHPTWLDSLYVASNRLSSTLARRREACVVDLERRVLELEPLAEDGLDPTANGVAVGARVDEHVRR